MIPYTKYRKIYFLLSGILISASVAAIFAYGLKPGIDFTGGSILEIEYIDIRPSNQEIRDKLKDIDLGSYYLQPTAEKGLILRTKELDEAVHNEILLKLGKNEEKIQELRFESIGPTIGKELKDRTKVVITLALLSMLVYIALAFRRIQRPLRSWQYALVSLVALFHDIILPLGILAILGKLYGIEVSIPVITALLTVLGYSINNTVVVFDRIRENIFKGGESFEEIVDKSLNQTLTRQLNTSLTTLFVIIPIYFFGGITLRYFSLVLILGICAGFYSSFFIVSPLLVSWFRRRQKR